MNTGESADTNTVLRYLLAQPRDPAIPVPQDVQDAACRLADRAHTRLAAGLTAADLRRTWTSDTRGARGWCEYRPPLGCQLTPDGHAVTAHLPAHARPRNGDG